MNKKISRMINLLNKLNCFLSEEDIDDLKDVAEHTYENKCNPEEVNLEDFIFGFIEGVRYKEYNIENSD